MSIRPVEGDKKYVQKKRVLAWFPVKDNWRVIPLTVWKGSDITFEGGKAACINWCKSKNESYEVVEP